MKFKTKDNNIMLDTYNYFDN